MHAFDVLGDPVRRRILELLADGELTAGAISDAVQAEFGISQPAVSQHLRVLRDSGFATVRPDGARRLYAVKPEPLRTSTRGSTPSGGSGHRPSTRWPPSWPEADVRAGEATNDRLEEEPMIDVDHADQRRPAPTSAAASLEAGEARPSVISQAYDADLDDLWDACTNAERIPRWFLPVSGDLRLGGRYQLEGNAGGTIERVRPAERLRRHVGVRRRGQLDRGPPDGRAGTVGTRFELEHIAHVDDERWAEFGPGAVGVGWDLGLIGLGLHLASGEPVDPAGGRGVERVRRRQALHDAQQRGWWRDASVAAGTDPAEAQRSGRPHDGGLHRRPRIASDTPPGNW